MVGPFLQRIGNAHNNHFTTVAAFADALKKSPTIHSRV